jgi:hypothetical protein
LLLPPNLDSINIADRGNLEAEATAEATTEAMAEAKKVSMLSIVFWLYGFTMATKSNIYTGLSSLGMPGVQWYPQILGRSVNPISTKGGRLCPPNDTGTHGFSDLPTALNYTYLLQNDHLKTAQRLQNDSQTTARRLPDNCLTTA